MNCTVINLDRRPERWERSEKELTSLGFNPTRFCAFEGGWRGCRDSHLKILSDNMDKDIITIFEDDTDALIVNPLQYTYLTMGELPDDWDALYLGTSPQEPFEWYSPKLWRMGRAFCTHATIWHNRKGGAVEYILENSDKAGKVDLFFSEYIYPRFNCFLTNPMIFTQYQSQSDCCTRSDLSTLVKNYNLYCR